MKSAARIVALALTFALPIVGCASQAPRTATPGGTPSAMAKTPDLESLAGMWDGWMKDPRGLTAPIQVSVKPDGTYASTIGGTSGAGTFQIVGDTVVTKGHLSGPAFGADRQSVVTIVEKGGRPIMTGEGRNEAGLYTFELTKRN